MRAALVFVVFLWGCTTTDARHAISPAPIIAAERAFAADAAQRGWAAAFRSAAAPDALMLGPDPVNAMDNLSHVEGNGSTNLDWRPAYAGMSRSGDFGFTTGPFLSRAGGGIRGHYFTVWRKQADGTWKWVFDGGAAVTDAGPPTAVDAVIPTLPIAAQGSRSADAAVAEVAAIETQIASGDALASDALARHLSRDAHVNRAGAPTAIGAGAGTALIHSDGGVAYISRERLSSSGGDLVFSLGEVRDQHDGAMRLRYYARVWQRQADGWRIVFDEIADS